MIRVHHLENSRSQRVLWLLEELGLPYEVVHYKRDLLTMLAPPELRAIHPLGKSPIISDGAQKNFIDPQIKQHLDFMEAEMIGRTWICGDTFSAADVQLSFPLEASSARGGLEANYPLLKALISRMHARPAYRRALEKGGPYELMR